MAAPYYLRFAGTGNVRAKIAALKSQCGIEDWQVQENTMLLGLLGQSRSSFMMRIYVAAAVLSVLVLCAGSLMIASSLNSNVAQRTEFFGLLRCVGATPRQVMRLVRKEALNWCRFAIPAGMLCGVAVIWILCAVLRALSPEYFGAIPVLSFSAASVLAGLVIGLLTVLLAARAPAKRAARVSPLAAVSGSANDLQPVRRAANTKLFKVDAALGIHHARESRKNFALMTGSFALSIVLFLSFSVPAAFFNHALTPLYPWAADISATSADGACSIAPARVNELAENPAVEAVYGRMCAYNVPVTIGEERKTALLVSYDARQFAWAEDYLQSGSVKDAENKENTALAIYSAQSPMQPGDRLSVEYGGQSTELTLGGILTASPAKANTGEEVIICAEETFRRITGESGYAVFDMRLANGATDAEVNEIRRSLGEGLSFSDKRADNESIMGAYYSVWLFIYGFLVLIALITVFNVINSVAMSVAARTKQYGVFRAIGLSDTQLSRMIVAEATAYAVTGSVLGTALGLGLNKLLFDIMISARWGDTWSVPVSGLIFILLLVAASVALAVYAPIKRIQKMSIVENIGAQ
ncbi:MAG: ABC transporter permease [Oscillospiraceae bacterium]|nr:ABC transporter permease [Oscillospiraceae bacterium]